MPRRAKRPLKSKIDHTFFADFPRFPGGLKFSMEVIKSNLEDCEEYGWTLEVAPLLVYEKKIEHTFIKEGGYLEKQKGWTEEEYNLLAEYVHKCW